MKKYAIISLESSEEITRNLARLDIEPLKIPATGLVEKPLSAHPDIQVFLCGERIFCHPGIDRSFVKKIDGLLEVIICGTPISKTYPHDVPYNIADTGTTVMCAMRYAEPDIMSHLRERKRAIADVKQGYAKCSVMIVNEQSVITSDAAIHRAAENAGLDALRISPGHISLPGYDYGFIGGASGMWEGTVFLTGDITRHPDYRNIMGFLERRGSVLVTLSGMPAEDMGSILIFAGR